MTTTTKNRRTITAAQRHQVAVLLRRATHCRDKLAEISDALTDLTGEKSPLHAGGAVIEDADELLRKVGLTVKG